MRLGESTKLQAAIGHHFWQEREFAGAHTEQLGHQQVAEFVQKHARQKDERKDERGHIGTARGNQKNSLDLAVQSTLASFSQIAARVVGQ